MNKIKLSLFCDVAGLLCFFGIVFSTILYSVRFVPVWIFLLVTVSGSLWCANSLVEDIKKSKLKEE